MKSAVVYVSKSGNTKKLADCIAKTLGVEAQDIAKDKSQVEADVLFLGASVYWAGIDGRVKDYIKNLDPKAVKKVVVFSTSALAQRAYSDIAKRLAKRGIEVEKENFYCRGEFRNMHKGKPDADDLKAASEFAKEIICKYNM